MDIYHSSRVLFLLLIGWILGLLLPVPVHPMGALLGVILFGIAIYKKSKRLAAIALIPVASWHLSNRIPQPLPHDASHLAPLRHSVIIGSVSNDPQFDGELTRFVLRPSALASPYQEALEGKVMAYYQGSPTFKKGDVIQTVGRLGLPPKASNFEGHSLGDRLKTEGIFSTIRIKRVEVLTSNPPNPVSQLREKVFKALSRGLQEEQGRLFAGIAFGASLYPVPPEMRTRYQDVGLAHILAASGVQVTLLAELFTKLLFRKRKRLGAILAILAVGGYAILAGGCPSIVRASLMTGAGLIGILAGRPFLPYLSFLGTGFSMLLFQPLWLWDLGFQFSFMATWALLDTPETQHSKALKLIVPIVAVSLWVLPFQVYHFGQCSLYGILANLLSFFLITLLTYSGFGTAMLVGIFPSASLGLAPFNGFLLNLLDGIVRGILKLPGAHFSYHLPLWGVCLIYASYAIWRWLPRDRNWSWAPIALAGFAFWTAFYPHPTRIFFLSVGQGDAMAIQTKHNQWILIDTGPPTQRSLVPFLRKHGCNSIELAVLTHPHADHQGGFLELAESIPIKTVWESGSPFQDPLSNQILGYLLTQQIPFRRPQCGERFTLDGVSLTVLSPTRPFGGNPNEDSLVIMANIQGWRTLLVGDADSKLESELLETPRQLSADLLKVAHHGSRFGSGQAFLKAVGAKVAVISVGPNNFRQPAFETLQRLHRQSILYRTDEDGAIQANLGEKLTLNCSNHPRVLTIEHSLQCQNDTY